MLRPARILAAFALFLIAFGARFASNARHFFTPYDPGTRNFEIFDSTYQIRRTEMTLESYPKVPFYDTYHYYPDNPAVPWPPGYNLFLATVAKPFHALGASRAAVQTVVGLVSCVVDAITVVLFLFFFSRTLPFPAAAIAAALLSVSSQNVGYSEIGYCDHHYFISFLIALFCLGLWRFDRAPGLRTGLLLGAGLGGAVFFNVSAIQYVMLSLAAVSLRAFLRRREEPFAPSVAVYAAAAAAALLAGFTAPAGRALEFRYDQLSLFHALIVTVMGAGHLLMVIWLRPSSRRGLLTAALAALMLALGAVAWRNVLEGARFLLVGNVLNYIQGEEISVRIYGRMWADVFTAFVFLAPLGLAALWRARRNQPFFTVVFALFFGHGLLTGLSHFLYVQYLYPWYAAAAAMGLLALAERARPLFGRHRWVVALPFFAHAGYVAATQVVRRDPGEISTREAIGQTIQAMAWLRENSPATSYAARGDGPPEYSVFAHRDHGHMIAHIARRPAVLSPFSTPDFIGHMEDYARFTLTPSEDEAVAILKKYRSRYLVLDARDNTMSHFFVRVLEKDPLASRWRELGRSSNLAFSLRNNLLFFDGELRWRRTPSIRRFRLVYEAPRQVSVPIRSGGKTVNQRFNGLKIFQVVEGARLSAGGFRPGERVVFRLPLETNTARRFIYSAHGVADGRGRVEVTLAYPSEPAAMSAVRPLAADYVSEAPSGRRVSVRVPSKAVEDGAELRI